MRRDIFSRGLFVIMLFSLVLTAGCQPGNIAVTPVPVDEPDYSCAYFYFLWGRQAELAMRLPEALEAYEKALICDPDADHIMRKIPVILLRMNRGGEAAVLLKKYLEKKPDAEGIRMLLARVYISLGQNDAAAREYRTIHRLDPSETRSLMLLSELYLNQNNLDGAEQVLKQVLEAQPESYPAHVLLGRIYLSRGKYDQALNEYDRALEISWSTDLLLEKSEVYAQQERTDELIAIYRQVLEGDPDNERVALSLVNALLDVEREEEALELLHSLKTRSGRSDRVNLSVARFYARMGRYDEAVVNLRKYLEKNNSSSVRYLLAVILSQAEQYEKSLAELQLISSASDEYENALALRVRVLRHLGRENEAVELLENILADGGAAGSPDLYVMLAALYQLQDRNEMGESTFKRALAAFPDDDELLYEYALFLDSAGESDRAISVMQEVLRRKPEHGGALNYVGYSWADRNIHLDKALEYIRKAVGLKPESGYIRDSLGWVYYRLGRLEEALAELREAVRLSPDDPTIAGHLADVYLELGRRDKALDAYRKSLELLEEDDREARDALLEKIRLIENSLKE